MNAEVQRTRWMNATRDVVHRLSMLAVDQVEYPKALGVEGSIDELGLEYDDVWPPLRKLLTPADEELRLAMEALDLALSSASISWAAEDLETSDWRRIRELAQNVLDVLDPS